MLKKVSLVNFKGLSNVDIELSNLNLFVGENGTGKSTVVQALSILRRPGSTELVVGKRPAHGRRHRHTKNRRAAHGREAA